MKYKFFPETESLKFKAFGDTIEEVFVNSAIATSEAMCEDKILSMRQLKIKVKGRDMESLLCNFLEELLFLIDSKSFILSKVRDIKIDKKSFKLIAKISGDDAESYKITRHVKAVTYSEMYIRKENKKWVAQVVLNV